MKELKFGDKVKVLFINDWITAYFICYAGDSKNFIYVSYDEISDVSQKIECHYILNTKWRISKEKKYRPFTWKERERLRGTWIKNKNTKRECLICMLEKDKNNEAFFIGIVRNIRWFCRNNNEIEVYSNNEILECFTFLDGSPCGVKE